MINSHICIQDEYIFPVCLFNMIELCINKKSYISKDSAS
jgi:hypothetical protein